MRIISGNFKNKKLDFPKNFKEYKAFYNIKEGGDPSPGYQKNPVTGSSYRQQMVPLIIFESREK